MQENKGYFVAEGLLYDYEFESLEIDTTSFRDEIELLKVADKCLRLATDAIKVFWLWLRTIKLLVLL